MDRHAARIEAAKRYAMLGEEAERRHEYPRAAAFYKAALLAIEGVRLDAEGSADPAPDTAPAAVDSRGKTPHRCTNTRDSAPTTVQGGGRRNQDPTTSVMRLVSGVRDAEADEQLEDETG
jgi:hypothetical protein